MIEIRNLNVSFDDIKVLKNISVNIPKNKMTVIIGRSGSGKSVLMKTVEGLIHPESGEVLIDNVSIFDLDAEELKEVRRKVAMLFQGSALFDSLNVYQNVALPLVEHTNLTAAEIEAKVLEKLQMVGLPEITNKMPSELSGGMRKRVALARAIILEPDYVIYDEPTTGLDPVSAREITDLIIGLQERAKITSIIITHDLECISRTGEMVIMLHEKEVIFTGSYSEIRNATHPAIRSFFQ